VTAPVAVIGAGPAGLTAALALAEAGRPVVLIEREDDVGGLARTVERDGFRFDLGGHRFFTRAPEIRALWSELAGDVMLRRRRRSRILYSGKYFEYPLTAGSAFAGLGPVESARIAASYLRARLFSIDPEVSFADWVTNRFGRRLFEAFFRTYTEKVWGMPCERIGAQWAAQRIRGLTLRGAVADMVRRGAGRHRSLATEFEYPRLGPGMLWNRMRARIEARGQAVLLGHRLQAIRHRGKVVEAVQIRGPSGSASLRVSHVISTIPLRDLAPSFSPALPAEMLAAGASLRHRDFLEVALILEGDDPFPDTWLYLHDPGIRAGRIQNFRAWSPELIPVTDRACLGLEYFCQAGDGLWQREDAELLAIAQEDLTALGFGRRRSMGGYVVRVRDAYPVYDERYAAHVSTLARGLSEFSNLATVGRNGTHRYNNMDHSMLSGLHAAQNVLGARHDLWEVNAEDECLEPLPQEAEAGSWPADGFEESRGDPGKRREGTRGPS
jgi:protoporphyrinogen oxidase